MASQVGPLAMGDQDSRFSPRWRISTASRLKANEKVFVTQPEGVKCSHTWEETAFAHSRALVMWSKEGWSEFDGEGWEIKDRSIPTQALESWVYSWLSLPLKRRQCRQKEGKRDFPNLGSTQISFSRFSISIREYYFHFQASEHHQLTNGLWIINNNHNYYCCLLSNYYVLGIVISSFHV